MVNFTDVTSEVMKRKKGAVIPRHIVLRRHQPPADTILSSHFPILHLPQQEFDKQLAILANAVCIFPILSY